MDTRSSTTTSLPRPGAGLVVRDRATGDLLLFPHRSGTIGAGSYGDLVRIGTGFLLGRVPDLVAVHHDGARQLLCLRADGREVLLPPAEHFDIGDLNAAPHRPSAAVQVVAAGPGRVLRVAADGTVRIGTATEPGELFATIAPGAVLLGMADVTGTGPELLVRLPGGGISAIEPGGVVHDLGSDWDGAVVVVAADVSGDGLADLVAFGSAGNLLVFPHSGVFWPQFPAVSFLSPVAVAAGVGAFDVIG